jgi:hypothetical protein
MKSIGIVEKRRSVYSFIIHSSQIKSSLSTPSMSNNTET